MSHKQVVQPDGGPVPIAPLTSGLRVSDMLFLSGQVPRDAAGVIPEDITAQTHMVIDNLEAILAAGGSSLQDVVRTTVYLTDVADADAMNAVYRERFSQPFPTRTMVEVSALGKPQFRIEIDAIALLRG